MNLFLAAPYSTLYIFTAACSADQQAGYATSLCLLCTPTSPAAKHDPNGSLQAFACAG